MIVIHRHVVSAHANLCGLGSIALVVAHSSGVNVHRAMLETALAALVAMVKRSGIKFVSSFFAVNLDKLGRI